MDRSAMYQALYITGCIQNREDGEADDLFLNANGKCHFTIHSQIPFKQMEARVLLLPNGRYNVGYGGYWAHSMYIQIEDEKYTILDQNLRDARGLPKPLVFFCKEGFARALVHFRIPLNLYRDETFRIEHPAGGYEISEIRDL